MLPYFVEQDFADVIAEQQQAGYALQSEWFAPHFEFRFPKHGEFATRGIEVELRHALEPWHVMGEEGAAGSTVRFVDSSVERLQVKATGLAPDRYVAFLQWPAHPAAADQPDRGVRRRGALQGLAAGLGAPPDHWRACAAGIRPGGYRGPSGRWAAASTT